MLIGLFLPITVGSSIHEENSSSTNERIHVLVYETSNKRDNGSFSVETFVHQIDQNKIRGITVDVFGQNTHFDGYGSKFTTVLPILQSMDDKNTLVVIADSRDVLVNNQYSSETTIGSGLATEFHTIFNQLTVQHPGAIVISAEAQCCVSALTHAQPGSYFKMDGTRDQRSCWSGKEDCLWAGDDKATPWESFMNAIMLERTGGITYDDRFLNAGLIVGTAQNLLRILQVAQIADTEDDQAVLTDYMYRHPSDIILDYQQRLFGNNRGGIGSTSSNAASSSISSAGNFEQDRCTFTLSSSTQRLEHTKTGTTPLFIHSPGGYYKCHDHLSNLLGIPAIPVLERQLLQQSRDLTSNYGKSESKDKTVGGLQSYLLTRLTTTSSPSTAPVVQQTNGEGLLNLLRGRGTERQLRR